MDYTTARASNASSTTSWISSSAIPTATTIPSCNSTGEQYSYTDPTTGSNYVVQCNQTYQGVVGTSIVEDEMQDCINACSANPQCMGVAYNTTDGVCDEYYAFASASGDYSDTVVFAQLRSRAVVFDGTITTTVPVSTSYVPLTAVTTPRPPTAPASSSFSALYTPTPTGLSLSSSGTVNVIFTISSSTSQGAEPSKNSSSLMFPGATGLSSAKTDSSSSIAQSSLSTSSANSTSLTSPVSTDDLPTSSISSVGVTLKSSTSSESVTSYSPTLSSSETSDLEIHSSYQASPSSSGGSTKSLGYSAVTAKSTVAETRGNSSMYSEATYTSAPDSSLTNTSVPASSTLSSTATVTTVTLSPSSTVCPDYNGEDAVNQNNATYHVQCGVAYNGTVINTGSSKRQSVLGSTLLGCTGLCDANVQCVGITLTAQGQCTIFSEINGYVPAPGSVAAMPLARVVSIPGGTSIMSPVSATTSTGSTAAASTSQNTQGLTAYNQSSAGFNGSTFTAQSGSLTEMYSTFTLGPRSLSTVSQATSTNGAAVVTVFVTPSTCSVPRSARYFITTTTYTTSTITMSPQQLDT
ncbi:hypothetical protein B0A50_00902 [Salinomyces thailandicus]|uniref:Apple domain-containing protein n=1 Tax=Salinomyces thailandicus TaxID=706561 RepID=A0A4V5N634_9PEZI|nr:hypothetical protein B0A50_00902 [Salinomyces thailandica]